MNPTLTGDRPSLPTNRLRNRPAIDRLMHRTTVADNGCWMWLGSCDSKGYGTIRSDMGGPVHSAHRVAYVFFKGAVPAGLEVDHLCFNRACVNPDHLEAITHAENVRRGLRNQNDGKRFCLHGHEFTAANTGADSRGNRVCRSCARAHTASYRARKEMK